MQSFFSDIIVSALKTLTLFCYYALFCLFSSFLLSFFFFFFFLVIPLSHQISMENNSARSNWNCSAICGMVSIRDRLLFRQSGLLYWDFRSSNISRNGKCQKYDIIIVYYAIRQQFIAHTPQQVIYSCVCARQRYMYSLQAMTPWRRDHVFPALRANTYGCFGAGIPTSTRTEFLLLETVKSSYWYYYISDPVMNIIV